MTLRPTSAPRHGYSLIELLVVMALILLVGAVVVPSLDSFMRDTNVKGAADLCVARLADARSNAIEEGRAYRFSSNPQGTRIRVSPDELDSSGVPLESPELPPRIVELDLPKGVILSPDGQQPSGDDGWITLITYLPDGTCKETNSPDFKLTELGTVPYIVQIRSLTGAVTVNMMTGAK
jgi:prepilin-type N-terminal cleavage/methylation domain-containing protein